MMNCRNLQNLLYEYVEGSLSANSQAAADQHLAECGTCRQAVRQEQQCAQFLFDRLRQGTETLALRPEVRRRVLRSVKGKSTLCTIAGLWNHFAWPVGMAASFLLIGVILLFHHFSGARVGAADAQSAVSIQLSYRVPAYEFRREGNVIIDSMADETVIVSETVWNKKPIREKQEKKTPL